MYKKLSTLLLLALIATIVLGSPGYQASAAGTLGRGGGGGGGGGGSLSQAEIDGLLFVREEEKMAHDVYTVMYAKWGMTVFSNITSAETNHMSAIKNLLDKYGLPDPVQGHGLGVFVNPDLQAYYNSLVAQGNQSQAQAVLAGGWIEEFDILDLEARKAASTHSDIQMVYTNLVSGSCNHLRAFSSRYKMVTGQDYQPQLLTSEMYLAIINGTYQP
jgi:hypothetical protein